MTTTAATYSPSLTGAVAREHVNDLLREATWSLAAAELPRRNPHRTPRPRSLVDPRHRTVGNTAPEGGRARSTRGMTGGSSS